jgi:hypothetical protein
MCVIKKPRKGRPKVHPGLQARMNETVNISRFFSEFFGFLLSISFHRAFPHSYIIWGLTIGPLEAAVQRQTHPIEINQVSEISSLHGGEYQVQNCLLGCTTV